MNPTRNLRHEHQVILRVLDCFEIALHHALEAGRVDPGILGPFLEFFQGFADRCHHCKEEDRLFTCLEQCGMPREHGPIAVMLHEHRLGRAHVKAMTDVLPDAESGDAAAAVLLREGRSFLDLLRQHIMKEDHVLFEMADRMVGGRQATNSLAPTPRPSPLASTGPLMPGPAPLLRSSAPATV